MTDLQPPSDSSSSLTFDVASATNSNPPHQGKAVGTTSKRCSSSELWSDNHHQYRRRFISQHASWAKTVFCEALRHVFHQKTSCFVASISVFFVVFTSTLLSVISNFSSLVITRFAELQVGEIDISIAAKSSKGFLNYTDIAELMENTTNMPNEVGFQISNSLSPRLSLDTSLIEAVCSDKSKVDAEQECGDYSKHLQKANVKMILYDHDTERKAHLGIFWPYRKLERGEVYVTKRTSKRLDISAGDMIKMSVRVGLFFNHILDASTSLAQEKVAVKVRVKAVLGSLHGKFQTVGSDRRGLVPNVLAEYSYFIEEAVNSSTLTMKQKQVIRKFNLKHAVSQVVMRIPRKRTEIYYRTDFAEVQRNVVQFSSKVLGNLRYSVLKIELPLLRKLSEYKFLALFVGLVVQVIILIFAILCFILLYSHLIYSVESRNMEMGVLRMLGMPRVGVVHLILAEVMIIAVPSWALAVGITQIVVYALVSALGSRFGASLPRTISPSAVGASCAVGLLLPVAASLLPMQKAIGTKPVDAFSWRRSEVSGTRISKHRSTGKLPIGLLISAALASVYGFVIFIVFPKAIMELNLKALVYLFELFILSILCGIILSVTSFDLPISLFLKKVTFFLERVSVHRISKMNLISHRIRNRKTFIMYSISVALIVYIQMSMNLQLETVLTIMRFHTGATYRVSSNVVNHGSVFDCCKQKLEQLSELPGVMSFTWVSGSNRQALRKDAKVTNLGGAYSTPFRGRAILPSYLSSTYKGTYRGTHKSGDMTIAKDVFEDLYTIKGSQSILVHDNLRKLIGLRGPGSPMAVKIAYKAKILPDSSADINILPDVNEGSSLLSTIGEFGGLPGFHKNKYSKHQPSLVSFPTYTRLVGGRYPTIDKLPLSIFLLHVDTKHITSAQLQGIERALDSAKGSLLRVESIEDSAESIEAVSGLLQFGFLGINVMVMTVCFFALVTSMLANAREQRKETAVLRAIGIREHILFRATFVEALSLLMGANAVGTFTGWTVAQMQHYQQALFLDLNSVIRTPWLTFTATLVTSMLSAAISASLSTRLGRNTILDDLSRV